MRYITKGQGSGEVQENLKACGIDRDQWTRVEVTVKKLGRVKSVRISYDGWLTAQIDCAQLTGERRTTVITNTVQQIERIISHKKAMQDRAAPALVQI